jgi:hypothetical protein
MQTLSPATLLSLFAALIVTSGLVALCRSLHKLSTQILFTAEFRERTSHFVNNADAVTYEWLMLNANRMQEQMGSQGLVTFSPPFENRLIHNYPVVLNILPKLRQFVSDEILSRNLLHQYHDLLDDTLLRHQGFKIDQHNKAKTSLKNPFSWITNGVRFLLAAPFLLLAELGVIQKSTASRVVASNFYKVFSGLIAIITFLSAIVGLVTGWEQFVKILRSI